MAPLRPWISEGAKWAKSAIWLTRLATRVNGTRGLTKPLHSPYFFVSEELGGDGGEEVGGLLVAVDALGALPQQDVAARMRHVRRLLGVQALRTPTETIHSPLSQAPPFAAKISTKEEMRSVIGAFTTVAMGLW